MRGDKLYCVGCGKYFVDINELYDSRNEGKPLFTAPKKVHLTYSCPHCFSNNIINVNQTMIDEIITIDQRENNYKGSGIYKKFIKDWPKLYEFYYETFKRAKETEYDMLQ